MLNDMGSDGVKEMGFSQPHAAVKEKGIVIFCRHIGDRQTRGMGKLVAGPHHKVFKGIFRSEVRSKGRGNFGVLPWVGNYHQILFMALFIFDLKLELTGLPHELGKRFFDLRNVVLVNPVLKKTVWNLDLQVFFLEGDHLNGFYPDVKVLLADLFF